MPLGIGLQLRTGESGFFLGDVKWGDVNSNSGFGVLTRCAIVKCKKELLEMTILSLTTSFSSLFTSPSLHATVVSL